MEQAAVILLAQIEKTEAQHAATAVEKAEAEQAYTNTLAQADDAAARTADDELRLQRGETILGLLEAMKEHGVSDCPVCTQHVADIAVLTQGVTDTVQTRKSQLSARIEARETMLEEAAGAQEVAASRHRAMQKILDDLAHQRTVLKARVATAQETVEAVSAGTGATYDGPDSASVKTQIDEIRSYEDRKRQIDECARLSRRAKLENDIAKELGREAATLLTRLIEHVAGEAETAVNKYMTEGFIAKLHLDDKHCEWRVVGMDDRAHSRGAMCGAERGMLTLALALAWTEDSPIRLLTLDDDDLHGFSPKNIGLFLTRIKELADDGIITQAFIAWSRPDEIPDGWNIINT
jgi:hypothetical protein